MRKRRALRTYRRSLGQRLHARYGKAQHYTPDQVRSTVKAYRMDEDFVCLALAMYCSRSAFDADHAARGEVCDYDAMHAAAGSAAEAFACGDVSDHGGGGDASDFFDSSSD